jgi:hypothetical protein
MSRSDQSRGVWIASLILLACMTPKARADILGLMGGDRVVGTIANSPDVRDYPAIQASIGIFVSETGEFRRVPAEQVEFVVLESRDKSVVIDFGSLDRSLRWRREPGCGGAHSRACTALPMMVGGLMLTALGAIAPFGGSEATVVGDVVEYSEYGYNWANYGMMAAGATMFVAGLIQLAVLPDDRAAAGPVVLCRDGSIEGVGVGWAF